MLNLINGYPNHKMTAFELRAHLTFCGLVECPRSARGELETRAELPREERGRSFSRLDFGFEIRRRRVTAQPRGLSDLAGRESRCEINRRPAGAETFFYGRVRGTMGAS